MPAHAHRRLKGERRTVGGAFECALAKPVATMTRRHRQGVLSSVRGSRGVNFSSRGTQMKVVHVRVDVELDEVGEMGGEKDKRLSPPRSSGL